MPYDDEDHVLFLNIMLCSNASIMFKCLDVLLLVPCIYIIEMRQGKRQISLDAFSCSNI